MFCEHSNKIMVVGSEVFKESLEAFLGAQKIYKVYLAHSVTDDLWYQRPTHASHKVLNTSELILWL